MMAKFVTLELAIAFYQKAKNYKFDNRVMQEQFNRALLSIPLNLSEGSGKPTHKDRRHFYFISYGSLRVGPYLEGGPKDGRDLKSLPAAEIRRNWLRYWST